MADDFSGLETVPSQAQAQAPTMLGGDNFSGLQPVDQDKYNQGLVDEKYGGIGQSALAAGEGAAQGIIGPIAPALERASGLTTAEDIRGRALSHPLLHAGSEALAFAGSSVFGDELGLAGVAGEAGNAAAHLIPGVAGVKTAAELATITASNEFSKLVEKDPNQTLGSAAMNVGLATALGGIGGNLLDKVNPLKYFAKNAMRARAVDGISGILGGVGSGIAGAGVGTVVGSAVGLPTVGSIVGGVLGEKLFSPALTYLARPLAEKLANLPAAEAAYDYLYSADAGQKALNNYIGTFFEKGAQTVSLSDMKNIAMPSQASRDDLEHILKKAQNIDQAIDIGSNISHYLPEHTSNAAETAARTANYFNSLKPVQVTPAHPLDVSPPIKPSSQVMYNRQLDIAQQPLMALQHVKSGTFIPQDLQTLKTVWPGVHEGMVQKITDAMIKNKEAAQRLPYAQKQALSQFMGGNALEASMTPESAQAIIMSASPKSQQMAQQTQSGHPQGHASSATLSQLNKVSSLYQTPLQARQFQKR